MEVCMWNSLRSREPLETFRTYTWSTFSAGNSMSDFTICHSIYSSIALLVWRWHILNGVICVYVCVCVLTDRNKPHIWLTISATCSEMTTVWLVKGSGIFSITKQKLYSIQRCGVSLMENMTHHIDRKEMIKDAYFSKHFNRILWMTLWWIFGFVSLLWS